MTPSVSVIAARRSAVARPLLAHGHDGRLATSSAGPDGRTGAADRASGPERRGAADSRRAAAAAQSPGGPSRRAASAAARRPRSGASGRAGRVRARALSGGRVRADRPRRRDGPQRSRRRGPGAIGAASVPAAGTGAAGVGAAGGAAAPERAAVRAGRRRDRAHGAADARAGHVVRTGPAARGSARRGAGGGCGAGAVAAACAAGLGCGSRSRGDRGRRCRSGFIRVRSRRRLGRRDRGNRRRGPRGVASAARPPGLFATGGSAGCGSRCASARSPATPRRRHRRRPGARTRPRTPRRRSARGTGVDDFGARRGAPGACARAAGVPVGRLLGSGLRYLPALRASATWRASSAARSRSARSAATRSAMLALDPVALVLVLVAAVDALALRR